MTFKKKIVEKKIIGSRNQRLTCNKLGSEVLRISGITNQISKVNQAHKKAG